MNNSFIIKQLTNDDYDKVCQLGNQVHGEGYLTGQSLDKMANQSLYRGLNASYVLYKEEQLLGFRISYAPTCWSLDQWCTPELWNVAEQNVAYFKCNTIHPDYQGQGLGGQLLNQSIKTLKVMGATAGLSHIWMQSPGNASFKYFSKAGGRLIKQHPRRWHEDKSLADYICGLCGDDCYCDASEMLLEFK